MALPKDYQVIMAQSKIIPLEGEQVHSEVDLRRLASAVFRRALDDVKFSQLNEQGPALNFLLKDEADFSFWCKQLDVDPKTFRQGLRKHIWVSWEGFPSSLIELL